MAASCLYVGRVRHRRFSPTENTFRYKLYMVYLDLAELDTVFQRRWLWSVESRNMASFRRSDHYGDTSVTLDESIRNLVEQKTGTRPAGPIRLLTHLRYFGYIFNPVSFYYCFDQDGSTLRTIVAEVHNTPWNEQHCYVLPAGENIGTPQRWRFQFAKDFHVSPFMQMEIDYDWWFGIPGRKLPVHMVNFSEGRRVFDATMELERRPITGASLARTLLAFPWMTGKVIMAIYYQALRLWLKRTPFHSHPRTIPAKGNQQQ